VSFIKPIGLLLLTFNLGVIIGWAHGDLWWVSILIGGLCGFFSKDLVKWAAA